MEIVDVTLGDANSPIRMRGRLNMPAHEAFSRIRPQFEAVGYTPTMRREADMDVVQALPVVFGQQEQRIPWGAILLLIATVFSVFYIGVGQGEGLYDLPWAIFLAQRTGNTSFLVHPELLPSHQVWMEAIKTGLLYTISLLGILGAHEMGHYLVARKHKVHTTLPFFIPMPFGILGTLGAVIAMREFAPNRRVQFDIGVAGPIAGLIVAIPVLIIGLMLSEVRTVADFLSTVPDGVNTAIIHEGQSLLYLGLKFLVFGQVLPHGDLDVWIHPVAFAGWAGLLVTALNLLPIGQLDGGHVLYGLFGDQSQKVRRPIIVILLIMAVFGSIKEAVAGLPPEMSSTWIDAMRFLAALPIPGWSGWWVWILLISFLVRSHAPVLDEITELDGRRKALGVAVLVIFVLIFTPTPLVIEAEPLAALFHWLV